MRVHASYPASSPDEVPDVGEVDPELIHVDPARAAELQGRLDHYRATDPGQRRGTASGMDLSDAFVSDLAAEAERGYTSDQLRPRSTTG